MADDPRIQVQEWTVPPPIVGPASVSIQGVPWSRAALRLEECWPLSKGTGCKIGIVDTGVDAGHDELAGKIADANDFTGSRYGPGDFQGHGSHVSGIIAGKTCGVAPEARIWMAKGLGDNGSGSSQQIVRALEWLGSQGVHVVNMSLGSPYPDQYIHGAIRSLESAGIAVFAAAGNSGPGPNTGEYPGIWGECSAVAAVDKDLKVASFSSRSPEVDIAGPGVNILSVRAGGGYVEMSGTSMATPGVVGCYALAWAANVGGRNSSAIRQRMFSTANDIDIAGRDPNAGWGFVQPLAMLQPTPQPMPDPNPQPAPVPGDDPTRYWLELLLKVIQEILDTLYPRPSAEASRPILKQLLLARLDQMIASENDLARKQMLQQLRERLEKQLS